MRDSDSPRPDSVKVQRIDIRYFLSRGGKARPTIDAGMSTSSIDEDLSTAASSNSDDQNMSTADGLWVPQTVPEILFSHSELARSRWLSFLFGLLATIVLGGLAAVVFLSVANVDTQPLLSFLALVCTPTFGAAGYALGHYFGHKEKTSAM